MFGIAKFEQILKLIEIIYKKSTNTQKHLWDYMICWLAQLPKFSYVSLLINN